MPRTVGHNALVRDVWKVVAAGDDDIGSRNLRVAEMIVNDDGKSNLPILLAGKGGGLLQPGRHVRFSEETPLANLWLSLLDRMDARVERFGDSTGRLSDL